MIWSNVHQSVQDPTDTSTQSSCKSEDPHQFAVAAWLPFFTLWITPKRLVAYYLKSLCIIIILLQQIFIIDTNIYRVPQNVNIDFGYSSFYRIFSADLRKSSFCPRLLQRNNHSTNMGSQHYPLHFQIGQIINHQRNNKCVRSTLKTYKPMLFCL